MASWNRRGRFFGLKRPNLEIFSSRRFDPALIHTAGLTLLESSIKTLADVTSAALLDKVVGWNWIALSCTPETVEGILGQVASLSVARTFEYESAPRGEWRITGGFPSDSAVASRMATATSSPGIGSNWISRKDRRRRLGTEGREVFALFLKAIGAQGPIPRPWKATRATLPPVLDSFGKIMEH